MIRAESENFGFHIRWSFDRIYSASARSLVLLLLFGWQAMSMGQLQAQEYKDPNFEVVVFDEDAISLQGPDRVIVVEALAALASNFPQNGLVDMELRQKALALALRLDSLNTSARATRQFLLSGKNPAPTEFFQKLLPIHKTLWTHAVAMKKGQELEDQLLYPLLMELALVINLDAAQVTSAVYAESVEAVGERLPKWEDFVPLSAGGKSKSSARAVNILSRGQENQKKWEAMIAAKEKQAAAAVAAALVTKVKMPVTPAAGDKPEDGKGGGAEVKLPTTEMNVMLWQPRRRVGVDFKIAKLSLNIRDALPGDAALFENDKGNTPEVMGMRLKFASTPAIVPRWLGMVRNILWDRFLPKWPKGKVAEWTLAFADSAGQAGLLQEVWGGIDTAAILTVESALKGLPLDPVSIVYVRALANQSFVNPPGGDLTLAVEAARLGEFQLIAVAGDAEETLKDWVALGDLDKLVRPQIVGVSNFDELIEVVRSDRKAHVEEAIELFSEIEGLTSKMTLEEASKNEVVQQRLQAITDQFPQHLSAKMLLAYGKGGDFQASLPGSVSAIENILQPFRERYANAMNEDEEDADKLKELGEKAEERIQHYRTRVDKETEAFLEASSKAIEAIVSYLDMSNKTSSSALRRREDVEEALVELNNEYRPLRDKVSAKRR